MMKTIGLLGGMSWESTSEYYRMINKGVKQRLGGLHSAKIALLSIDFAPLEKLQHQGDWPAMQHMLAEAAQSVQSAGADCLLICTNTMHKVAPGIEEQLDIPLLHIADATGSLLQAQGHQKVGLLGTAFTMEQEFYKGRLSDRFDLEVLVPETSERDVVHRVIYEELCRGQVRDASRQQYLDIIAGLQQRGAQAVVLGCTEIGLLIQQGHTDVPLIDTTDVHAQAAVDFALGD